MLGSDIARDLLDAVNGDVDSVAFQEGVADAHHALQQRLFDEVLKPGIVALAGVQPTDRRNEEAVSAAQEVCEKMEWEY